MSRNMHAGLTLYNAMVKGPSSRNAISMKKKEAPHMMESVMSCSH